MSNSAEDREPCVIHILSKEHEISTERILELALTPEFKEICRDCKSGVEVYETVMKLYRLGQVTRKQTEGGFVWRLK